MFRATLGATGQGDFFAGPGMTGQDDCFPAPRVTGHVCCRASGCPVRGKVSRRPVLWGSVNAGHALCDRAG